MEMRRKIKLLWIVVIVLIMGAAKGEAQLPEYNFMVKGEVPVFYYDVVTSAAEDSGKSLLRNSMKIAYDELQFVREEGRFRANYEVSVTIFDQQGVQADGKILEKEVVAYDFKETNSGTSFSLVEIEFELSPGEYNLQMGIMDLDSKKIGRRKTKITVPDFSLGPLNVSAILMADHVTVDSSGAIIPIPNVLGNYGATQNSLFLWYEIYNRIQLDSVKVVYRIMNHKKKVIRELDYYKVLDGVRTVDIVEIPRGNLEGGRYRLELNVGMEKAYVKRFRDFTVHWIGMPVFASDLNKAIEQLKYIAKSSDIKKINKAKGDEKEKLFRDFWRSKDPSPGTEGNELMEEYYRRVAFVNANFGSYKEGWKTDRGMVYIILGPPNEIERRPFDPHAKPYEVWSYYDINRLFVFVDQSGFGEYRLITPNWDVLRLRE